MLLFAVVDMTFQKVIKGELKKIPEQQNHAFHNLKTCQGTSQPSTLSCL